MRRNKVLAVAAAGVLAVCTGVARGQDAAKTQEEKPKVPDKLQAVVETDKGEIRLELYPDDAPLTVTNFVNLSRRGFYDGLKFHRVLADFMVQGGCPLGTGTGGPGYRFKDETTPSRKHDGPGVLSMANSGPGTNGSQFFITHKETPWLDGKHTIFGRVLSGQDVVNKIQQNDVIKTIRIEGDASALFEKNKQQVDEWDRILDVRFPKKNDPEAQKKREAARKKQKEDALAFVGKQGGDASKGADTSTGLWHLETAAGTGASPKSTEKVKLHCTGWLWDGTKFYSTHDSGQPLEMKVDDFVPGFAEGVQLMKPGGKCMLIIPGELGYGMRGHPGAKIPPDATLVYEVELLAIVP